MSSQPPSATGASATSTLPWWQPVLFAALAGGMGWGIRGQYGHETGAMIAGLLMGLVLVLLIQPEGASLPAARAVAFCTVAIGFGGSMTYGQTIGLTQNAPVIGNWDALRWGLLGLAIKGGIWIGFAGLFLGMGLGGVRYRPLELLAALAGAVWLLFLGLALLNEPFDPANKALPKIYFSADWHWQPDATVAELKPRRECWGGLLLALAGLVAYAGVLRKDRLARRLAGWAFLGGAIGFPLGQCLQAYHAWNPDVFRAGLWVKLDPHMNWWNMMEITFGTVAGATLGLGLWLNRRLVAPPSDPAEVRLKPALEWGLLVVGVSLLAGTEFVEVPQLARLIDIGLLLGIIPLVAIVGGRWWPYLLVLPVTALPIAGKTLRQLVVGEKLIAPAWGWFIYLVLPVVLTTVAALWFARRAQRPNGARPFLRRTLLLATWLYFGLNYAFFHFPWPWEPWTGRTPSGIVFTVCAVGLTVAASVPSRPQRALQGRGR